REVWRIGIECYYTGRQRLEENPYRARSEPYVSTGFLVERKLGPVRLFLNAENLGDARQTRWNPLLRPSRAVDGRWTVDAWAPVGNQPLLFGWIGLDRAQIRSKQHRAAAPRPLAQLSDRRLGRLLLRRKPIMPQKVLPQIQCRRHRHALLQHGSQNRLVPRARA